MASTVSVYEPRALITVMLVLVGGCAKASPTPAVTALEAINLPTQAERVTPVEDLTLNDPHYFYANRSFFLPTDAMKTTATLKTLCQDNGFTLEATSGSSSGNSISCIKTSGPYISLEMTYDCKIGCEVGLQLFHGND